MYLNKTDNCVRVRDVPIAKAKESVSCGTTKHPSDINEVIDRLHYAVNRYSDLTKQVTAITTAVCRAKNVSECCDAKCEEDYSMANALASIVRHIENNNTQLDSVISRCQLTPYDEKS